MIVSAPALALALLFAAGASSPGGGLATDAGRGREASRAQLEAWLAANPGSPEAPRALVGAARLWLLDGREDRARPLLERARREGAGTRWESAAAKELADLDAASRDWTEASAAYDRLAASPDPYWSTLGTLSAAGVRRARAHWRLMAALLTALLLLISLRVGLALRAGARPWPVPAEVLVGAPIAALLVAGALGKQPAEVRAVASIAVGGLALLWANALALRGRTLTTARRLGEAALGAGQALALAYCAVVANGLWGKLVDTLRMGVGS